MTANMTVKLDPDFLRVGVRAYRNFQNAPVTDGLKGLYVLPAKRNFEWTLALFDAIHGIVAFFELERDPISIDELKYVLKAHGLGLDVSAYIAQMLNYGYIMQGSKNFLHTGPEPIPEY